MVLSSIHTEPMTERHANVEVESVLRLRPLMKKEREDSIVLEPQKNILRNAPATAVLNPLHTSLVSEVSGSSLRSRSESDATSSNTPTDYHFNHVLPENASQDKIYYTLGLPIATASMSSLKMAASSGSNRAPKNHLLICIGVTNSGKTYTCFGGSSIPKRRASQDGLIPRLVDSLFSQSKHHASGGSKGFAVQISVTQVSHSKGSDPHACQIQDLLASAPSKTKTPPKRNLVTVRSMAAKFERALPSPIRSPLKSADFAELDAEDIQPTIENCRDVSQAREVLQTGLNASKKAAKGQNHHLLITLQPVLNGTQFGDKIAILDMAGLEKGKRSQNRGKDSVANMNQAASAAVLHCLRTMIHNTNARNGRSDPLDIVFADDVASEISCVSQEKNPIERRLKPVPFRQHSVTMLLNPLFTSIVDTKVTLLLTAYPGHVDYHEKKSLLQDMELLCGAALLSSKAIAATGLDRSESRSVITSETNEESIDQDPVYASRGLPSNRRMPSRQISVNSLTLSTSNDEGEGIRPPPAYAPSFSKGSSLSKQGIRPSAPLAEPVAGSSQVSKNKQNPPKNPNFVSDFPGVSIPSKGLANQPISIRQRVTTTVSSAMFGGPKAREPPSREDEDTGNSIDHRQKKARVAVAHGADRGKPYSECDPRDSRLPLGRSSLENGRLSLDSTSSLDKKSASRSALRKIENQYGSPREPQLNLLGSRGSQSSGSSSTSPRGFFKQKKIDPHSTAHKDRVFEQRIMNKEAGSSPKSSYSSLEPNQNQNRSSENRVKELEAQVKELLRQKKGLEHRCGDLEKENKQLKKSVCEAGRQTLQSKWTNQDEEEFLNSRKLRLEDQNLVKGPLMSHMEKVNYTYDIKNQWCMSDKPHFDLRYPSHFQRAPTLDKRDKQDEEKEAMVGARDIPTIHTAMPAVKLNFESHGKKQKEDIGAKSGNSSAKRNSFAALKKLALKSH